MSADVQRAAARLGLLLQVGKSAMRSAGAHPDAVVADVQDEAAVLDADRDDRGSRAGVPDDVGQRFP